MREKTCFVIGAGKFEGMPFLPEKGDLVIAADGGYQSLRQLGVEPDVLMGDFDSLDFVPEHLPIMRHPPEKDDTDMALAVAYGEEQGFCRFMLYGGLGGRLDHTVANLQLLTLLSRKGTAAYLSGDGYIVTALTKERIVFSERMRGMISVFCSGESAEGVTLTGLKYPLDRARLTCERALGVSNEFTGRPSSVEVERGTLLLMWNLSEGLEESRSTLR